jgi:mycoredoxin
MPQLIMYTTSWCGDCRRAKAYLQSRGIAFEEVNIEETPGAAERVVQNNGGKRKVPTFELEGRFFACSPFDSAALEKNLSHS